MFRRNDPMNATHVCIVSFFSFYLVVASLKGRIWQVVERWKTFIVIGLEGLSLK